MICNIYFTKLFLMRSTLARSASRTLYQGTSRSNVDTTHICAVVISTVMVVKSLCQCHKPDSNWVKNILSFMCSVVCFCLCLRHRRNRTSTPCNGSPCVSSCAVVPTTTSPCCSYWMEHSVRHPRLGEEGSGSCPYQIASRCVM